MLREENWQVNSDQTNCSPTAGWFKAKTPSSVPCMPKPKNIAANMPAMHASQGFLFPQEVFVVTGKAPIKVMM